MNNCFVYSFIGLLFVTFLVIYKGSSVAPSSPTVFAADHTEQHFSWFQVVNVFQRVGVGLLASFEPGHVFVASLALRLVWLEESGLRSEQNITWPSWSGCKAGNRLIVFSVTTGNSVATCLLTEVEYYYHFLCHFGLLVRLLGDIRLSEFEHIQTFSLFWNAESPTSKKK